MYRKVTTPMPTALLAACLIVACAQDPVAPPHVPDSNPEAYFPGAEWRTASPADVEMDPEAVTALVGAVTRGEYGAMDALVIIKDGYRVAATYPNWTPGSGHTLQSVSKSVTSLLVGRAVAEGHLRVDGRVLDYFPDYAPVEHLDDRKRNLRVSHLLTMRTAMDFHESPYPGSPLDELNRSQGDWVKFVLDRRMTGEPGSAWRYNSGAVILTSGLLRAVTGEETGAFADRVLFDPLGITTDRWFRSPYDGLPHTGGGLFLSPEDLARIGWLVLNEGRWNGEQVVPASWLRESFVAASRPASLPWGVNAVGYGYWWWLFPSTSSGNDTGAIIAGIGARGQWLFIVPAHNLVVAIAGSAENRGPDLLYQRILPAIRPGS